MYLVPDGDEAALADAAAASDALEQGVEARKLGKLVVEVGDREGEVAQAAGLRPAGARR